MRKILILIFVLSSIHVSIFGQKTNLNFGSGFSGSDSTRLDFLSFHYTNPKVDIISELIKVFGDSYEEKGGDYRWENTKVKILSRKHLSIKVEKRIYNATTEYHEFYYIYIKKNKKNFLHEIKIHNRKKVRQLFKKFAEPT